MNRGSSSKTHLPGVKVHLEGGRKRNTSGVSSGSPEVDNVRNAFTLAEILVVMAIVAIVGLIMVVIFTNTLRGSNKSQILAVIKQNGQAALNNMDKTIRDSNNVICPSTSESSLNLVVETAGIYTRYRFISPFPITNPITNGLIQQDNPVKVIPEGRETIETDAEFMSRVCSIYDPMSEEATVLTDTNPQSGVSVESGSFTRNKSAGFKDQVTVRFNLKPGVGIPSSIANQIDPVAFQTTIELR